MGREGVGGQEGHRMQMPLRRRGGIASRLGRRVSVIGRVRY